MSDEKAELITDIVIPICIMLGLFLINGIALAFILRKRKNIVYEEEFYNAANEEHAIEMEQLY